ncbi:MAG: nitroreductase family protein [Bacteroidota bacterium]
MNAEIENNDGQGTTTVAKTYPLHPLISSRKSTRAFSEKPVEPEKLRSLLEAARWAPSASNKQPWRFIVAVKERQEDHDRMVNLLVEGNRAWAEKAPVLILSVAQVTDNSTRKANKFAFHDIGLATENLAIQATSLGLAVHLMGGFYADRARATFNIPVEYEPVAVIALGYEGRTESLPQTLIDRELAPRVRKPLSEFVFDNIWEAPSSLLSNEQTSALTIQSTINN